MDLREGLQLNPNIKLVRPLGAGGMALVWVAEHLTLKTEVAVKFINPELAKEEPTLLTRFEREASTAAQIKSPHVVQMLDHGVTDGVPYIVMELLEGESLAERLMRSGRMNVDDVETLLKQCAKALTKAHQLGIIHRDLKPDNLFLIDSGYEIFVKVLDFGIAKQTGQDLQAVTASMAVVGTPRYMSLEQLVSTKDVTHSTDLWALAVIAHHALTGTVPFDSDTLPGLTMKMLEGTFTPVTQLNPTLPKALDAWFERALQKQPGDRFATARELVRAFSVAIGKEAAPPSAEPATPDFGSTVAMAPEEVAPLPSAPQPAPTAAMNAPPVAAAAPTPQQMPSGVTATAPSASTVSAITSAPRPAPSANPWAKVVVALVLVAGAVAVALIVTRPAGSKSNAQPASNATAEDSAADSDQDDESAAKPDPTSRAATSATSASPVLSASTSASADASANQLPVAVPNAKSWPRPQSGPRPAPPPPSPPSPKTKPAYCATDGFYRNAAGRMVPKPECL